jgi:hypothetical protein
MNKFQKLSQLNKDIELLENAGKIKAAEVLHKKFIREAQYAMPLTYNPMMFNPMMFNPMAYNPMAARTVVNPTGAVSQPSVQAPTTPVANQQTVSVPPAAQAPSSKTTGNQTPPKGITYEIKPPQPVDMGIPAPPTPVKPPAPPNPYDNFYNDPKTGKTIFVDPKSGDNLPGLGDGVSVSPPGSISPPSSTYSDPMQDPRVKEFWNKIGRNDFLSGKQKQQMLDQFMRSIGLK